MSLEQLKVMVSLFLATWPQPAPEEAEESLASGLSVFSWGEANATLNELRAECSELPSILEILGRAGAIRSGKVGYNPSPVPDEEGHRGFLDLARLELQKATASANA